jgi:GNAT superfamily N-acetyltransferase
MDVCVRHLTADDWELWRDLRLRSLADAPDAFGSTLERELGFTERDWRDRAGGFALVAVADGSPASIGAGFVPEDGCLHVVAMWTAPEHRGRGLAVRVLEAIATEARTQQRRLVLDVTRGNGAARRTYERFGFVPTGESSPLRPGSGVLVDRMELPGHA